MSNPSTVKWDNRSNNRNYNLYTEEYFGGSDAFIYIDGERDNSISHIQFSIQEQHKPIYGYGSRTFDDLAVGTRIVVGAMRIPVRNTESQTDFTSNSSYRIEDIIPRVTVPEWVYNYRPDLKDNVPKSENEEAGRFSLIAKVQDALGLRPTGFIDNRTRRAISMFRKTNGMMMDMLIDNDILTRLKLDNYNYKSARKAWLYTDPKLEEGLKVIEKGVNLVYVAGDDRSVLVKADDGVTGYIDTGAVIRA